MEAKKVTDVEKIVEDEEPERLDLTIPPPAEMIPPQEFRDRLPAKDLEIAEFIRRTIPDPLFDDIVDPKTATSSVGSLEPTGTIDDIFKIAVPSPEWMNVLEPGVKERRSQDNTIPTIIHPTRRHLVFPLWIITAWRTLRAIALEWAQWRIATQWINQRGDSILAVQAKELVAQTRRNTYRDIAILALLASNRWLADSHFEIIAGLLNKVSTLSAWTASSTFATSLRKHVKANGTDALSKNQNLKDLAAKLVEGGYEWFLIPTHIDGNHWILFEVNLHVNTLAWGVYLIPPPAITAVLIPACR